jgi:hypothetical protein
MQTYGNRRDLDGMAITASESRPENVNEGHSCLMVTFGKPPHPTAHVAITPDRARDLACALWEEAEALEAWAEKAAGDEGQGDLLAGTH